MSSSSSSFISKIDVFISCSPQDPDQQTFASDLDSALSLKGMTTYLSYFVDELPEAGRLSPEESKLVVVVVSESYPTSVFCLNQLETIINSHDQGRLSVLPIYYGIDPSNVRNQNGDLKESFRKLGEVYPSEKVQAWRNALTRLTNISGLDSRYWWRETNMVDLITDEILSIVLEKSIKPSAASGLIGLDRHMQTLYEFLDLKANEEVRLVGICGPGGIGKTTLARYVYETMSNEFHSHMFVENAEKFFHHDQGMSQFTPEEIKIGANKTTRSLKKGYEMIKSTLGHRKSLLVVDCVDNVKQLKEVADIVGCWCSPGSRVIFVTQEKSLLVESGVKYVYEVDIMRCDEALQLLSQHAFKQQYPPPSYESVSLRACHVAGFLPLTLKILGSSLHGKNEVYWERELQNFEGEQERAIMEVMKKR